MDRIFALTFLKAALGVKMRSSEFSHDLRERDQKFGVVDPLEVQATHPYFWGARGS